MRVLLIGGGCRGLTLARGLVADRHAVRAVTRDERGRARIEAAGAECWIGDPDVVGTLRYALENVTILVWALGTATGGPEQIAALHGPRLEMMLGRVIDSTVRGVVYEAAGSVGEEVLAAGAAELRRTCERNEIPYALVTADPADGEAWTTATRNAMDRLLGMG
ncbi:MAG TPA: hypothetical protein VL120_13790 [Solirubrobacteraceae bacterium]|nr:hypothetical protein [Solirubrobacteraceae bacterium]